jgi:hypothetical protein
MTKRRSAEKFPLALYGRSAARYRSKSFMISIAMLGLWFITYTTEFLPRLAPLNRWMLAGGLVAALYWTYTTIGPRFAFARAREDHLWVQTPLYRLKISYRRIQNTRPVQFGKLYPASDRSRSDRRLLKPYFSSTALGIDLRSWPIHPLILRVFFGKFSLAPDQPGLILLVNDWMSFSNQLSTAMERWRTSRSERQEGPGIGVADILRSGHD